MQGFKNFSMLLMMATLAACSDSGVEVYSQFNNSQDISEGDAIYFNGRSIGEVVDVTPKDNGTFVTMSMNPEAADKISSRAAVVINRLKPGAPIEVHSSADSTEVGLSDGDKLTGLDSMMGLVAWSVGDALKMGTNEVSKYVDSFTEYLNSEEFESDKNVVQEQLESAATETMAGLKEVETEIKTALEETQLNEEQLAAAVEEFGNEISPIVEGIANNGAKLAQELERFAQGLQEQSEERQQSGSQFLQSLIATLEKLNQSMEKGLDGEPKQAEPPAKPSE